MKRWRTCTRSLRRLAISYRIEISDRIDVDAVAEELGGGPLSNTIPRSGSVGGLEVTFKVRTPTDIDDAHTQWDMQLGLGDHPDNGARVTQAVDLLLRARALPGVRRGGLTSDFVPIVLWQEQSTVWYNRSLGRVQSPDFESWILRALASHGIEPVFASEEQMADGVFSPEPMDQRLALAQRRIEAAVSAGGSRAGDGADHTLVATTDTESAAQAAVELEQQLHRYSHAAHVADLRAALSPLLIAALLHQPEVQFARPVMVALSPTPYRSADDIERLNEDLAHALERFAAHYVEAG